MVQPRLLLHEGRFLFASCSISAHSKLIWAYQNQLKAAFGSSEPNCEAKTNQKQMSVMISQTKKPQFCKKQHEILS